MGDIVGVVRVTVVLLMMARVAVGEATRDGKGRVEVSKTSGPPFVGVSRVSGVSGFPVRAICVSSRIGVKIPGSVPRKTYLNGVSVTLCICGDLEVRLPTSSTRQIPIRDNTPMAAGSKMLRSKVGLLCIKNQVLL